RSTSWEKAATTTRITIIHLQPSAARLRYPSAFLSTTAPATARILPPVLEATISCWLQFLARQHCDAPAARRSPVDLSSYDQTRPGRFDSWVTLWESPVLAN